MTRAANLSVIAAAACVGIAALVMAWGQTTRTTALPGAGVYRESLLTGEDQICGASQGQAFCVLVTDAYRPPVPPRA